jgi:NADPH-dependent ferric siderophore reductase
MSEMRRGCVLDRRALTARTVRITLGSAGLIGVVPRPAQDIELLAEDETRWLVRGDRLPGAAEPVLGAVEALPDPSGFGQVYLLSESRTVRSVRDLLEARGVARDRIFAKGYWNSQAASPALGRS